MLNIGKLFRNKRDEEELASEEEQQLQEPQETEEIQNILEELSGVLEEAEEEQQEAEELPELELHDELLELWQKFVPNSLAPSISLVGKGGRKKLHLTVEELKEERDRIAGKLSQESKRRAREIQGQEAKELARMVKEENLDLKTVKEQGGASLELKVDIPADCSCCLSRNKLVAWIFVFPPVGQGKPLEKERIRRELQQNNVVKGVDDEAIALATKPESYFHLVPVAIGTPAKEGRDGYVEELFPREIVKKVKLDEHGTADYRASNYVQIVEENVPICKIFPPVEGEDGCTVEGKELKPKKVRPAKVPHGTNTKFNEEGSLLLTSAAGHLEYANDAFHVRPVLDIPGDVDYSTGNIDFPGDVHIKGNVREGFEVKARGSVMVDGLVEGALVQADGDLLISCGVVGDNHAVLKSKGDIRVKYLENCDVYSEKSVFADCIVTSHIFCDESLSVLTGRGSIIGGTLTVGESVAAKILGARSGRETELNLGEMPCKGESVGKLEEELEQLERDKDAADKDIRFLESRGNDRNDPKLAKARLKRSAMDMVEKQLQNKLEQAKTEEIDLSKCRVECETAYPITKLNIDGKTWNITSTKKFYKVMYDKQSGELREIL